MAGAINFQKSIVHQPEYIGAGNLPINKPFEDVSFYKENSPFEAFLQSAVNHLNEVSKIEIKANSIIEDYVQGKASVEDAAFALGKSREMLRFTTAVVNNMVTSFKEIQQMQI